MCICVSQEGAGAQFTCLCSITHPCIVGRKVASFCAFLWVIVILQLNSFEFIQPSWILSVYFYVCGETEPRREREGENHPIALVGLTVGFTLKHEILHINILGLLSLQRLILEILPGETKVACSQPLPCLPFLHRGLQGVPVALAASLEAFNPCVEGGWGQIWVTGAERCLWPGRRSWLGQEQWWVAVWRFLDCGLARVSSDRGVGLLPLHPWLRGLLVRAELQVHLPWLAGTKALPVGLGGALWFKVLPGGWHSCGRPHSRRRARCCSQLGLTFGKRSNAAGSKS